MPRAYTKADATPPSEQGLIIAELQRIAGDKNETGDRRRKAKAWLDRIIGYGRSASGAAPFQTGLTNEIRQHITDRTYQGS